MATPKNSTMPPPQKKMTDSDGRLNRAWLDWFENADRVLSRIEREGSGEGGDVLSNQRYHSIDASEESKAVNLPSPIGNLNDFVITRIDNNWSNTVTITVQNDVATIHEETIQYLYPQDTAHIQAMSDVYRFI